MRSIVSLLVLCGIALGYVTRVSEELSDQSINSRALSIMARHPLIDGHVDLPFIVKTLRRKPLEVVSSHNETMPGHIDLARMRMGRLGGLFMVAWTPCSNGEHELAGNFTGPNDAVRDTLEAIDIIHETVKAAPDDLVLALSSKDIVESFSAGKISTLIGVEGGHQLGNSLSVVRLYARLGVRYITLTHTCHNAFASSAGSGVHLEPVHPTNGLTLLGKELVVEMNRLGLLVDLSHTSDQTMRDAIALSVAPVIFTHSGAQAIYNHPRNVCDEILRMIGDAPHQNSGLVMSVFYPPFIDPKNATVQRVADHIEHIAAICGKKHVGISSDFDGMDRAVLGLEDASQYPNLIIELIRRGWTDDELADIMGRNLMRVLDEADTVRESLSSNRASPAIYHARKDLPVQWGGPNGEYLPADVKEFLGRHKIHHDEL